MPSANPPSARIASPTSDHNGCGPDQPLGILLRSLGAAEAGQAGTAEVVSSEGARRDTHEAGQTGIDNAAPGVAAEADWGQSVFPKIFNAASLQGMDDAYRAIRVNPEHVALVSLIKTYLANECRKQVSAAFQSGDKEALLRLINELDDKVVSQLDLAHKWHVVEGLSHLSHRDHERLAQCFATGNIVDDEWADQNGEWKKMNRKPRVEDLARSLTMPVINDRIHDRIPSWLMWLFPVEEVRIGPGAVGDRMQTKGLVRTLTTALILGASIVIGTPIVVLATEAFPKPVNILVYVLAYLAVLVNVNVGGN